ncbi:hypothetical protein TNCV_3772491 [Trichonephila clavipes]|nr:hypothetical protein TNCV_3772491 [Trichonephila clavipes]
MRTTPELAPLSPNFYTTPAGGHFSLDILNVYRPSLHGGSSAVLGSDSWHAVHESVTLTTTLPRPPCMFEHSNNDNIWRHF